jgi:peptide deformylase
MAVLTIRKYPDKVLKRKSEPVEAGDKTLACLIEDMIETLHASYGVGLAAPQVGVQKRLIVVDVSGHDEDDNDLLVLINPEIVEADEIIDSEEGCLSVPEYVAHIKRAARVVVKGLDRNCKPIEVEAHGLMARALQHEIDHLDGILIIDRLSALKREFFEKKHQKAAKESKA